MNNLIKRIVWHFRWKFLGKKLGAFKGKSYIYGKRLLYIRQSVYILVAMCEQWEKYTHLSFLL